MNLTVDILNETFGLFTLWVLWLGLIILVHFNLLYFIAFTAVLSLNMDTL